MAKRIIFLAGCVFLSISCSLFQPGIQTYPSGVVFPLEKTAEVAYEGEVIDGIQNKNGKVFFSTYSRLVYCIDIRDRRIDWRFQTDSPCSDRPYLGRGAVYVLDEAGRLYSLSENGTLHWQRDFSEQITGLGENLGKVYLGTKEGNFFALDASTGEELWRLTSGNTIRENPVFWNSLLVFWNEAGYLFFLDQQGTLVAKVEVGTTVDSPLLVDGDALFFGSSDHYLSCFNLAKKKIRWKARVGGRVVSGPVSDEKRVFFICTDSVLSALHKRSGSLLWWQMLPARTHFKPEIVEEKVVAASLSPLLVGYVTGSGKKTGEFETGEDIRSNPLWVAPYLLVTTYDHQEDRGKLLFLEKVVKVTIVSSRESPLTLGEDVTFTASASGFFNPQYEFFLRVGEKREVVQRLSRKNTWTWFPEQEGSYIVGVRVVDGKQETTEEISFICRRH